MWVRTAAGLALVLSSVVALGAGDATIQTRLDQYVHAGDGLFAKGQFARAIGEWTEADRLARENNRDAARSSVLGRRAEAYQALGHYPKAIADLETAITLAPDDSRVAALRGSLGNVLFLSGDFYEAARALGACLQYAESANDQRLAAITLNNIGNLLLTSPAERTDAQGWPENAVAAYGESRVLAAALGDDALAANALLNLARAEAMDGSVDARHTLRKALAAYHALPDTHQKAVGLVAAGYLLLQTGRAEAGGLALSMQDRAVLHRSFDDAAHIALASGDARTRSYALGYLAELHEAESDEAQALRLTRDALVFAERANAPEISYLWQWQSGRLLKKQREVTRAAIAYRAAIATLRSIRSDMVIGYGGSGSFEQTVRPLFVEYVELLLDRADATTDPEMVQVSLNEARQTMELLKTAELEDYFRDDCVAELQAKVTTIEGTDSRTAALYPILLSQRTELLLSLPSGIKRVTVPVGEKRVTEEVRFFRTLLERRTRQYLEPAQTLYDWLIRPVDDALQTEGIETLVFIPGGSLRTIPIAALHDGKSHLVERYAIAITPGLTLLDPRPIQRGQLELLVGGLTESVQEFPELPHVDYELQSIQDMYGGRVLKDDQFRTTQIEQELDSRPFSVVHFATHAEVKADAKSSFLLTYDGRFSMDGLERFVKLSRFRDEPVELLTLSACATAAGDDRAALGLAGLAVKAGARSVLASLWQINDQAAADLVAGFYSNLRDADVSKAKALQRAQLTLIADKRYRYPVYWAPFVLIGNWL